MRGGGELFPDEAEICWCCFHNVLAPEPGHEISGLEKFQPFEKEKPHNLRDN